jgi:hypothetical protein
MNKPLLSSYIPPDPALRGLNRLKTSSSETLELIPAISEVAEEKIVKRASVTLNPTRTPAAIMQDEVKHDDHKDVAPANQSALDRLERLRLDRLDAFNQNPAIEEFLDSIPPRNDEFPTLVMMNCKSGIGRSKPEMSLFATTIEFIWPLFFWVDMLSNVVVLLKALFITMFKSVMPSTGISVAHGATAVIFLALPIGYGWYQGARVCLSLDPDADTRACDSFTDFKLFDLFTQTDFILLMVFYARAFGKACTLLHFIGVMFATRTLSTM